MKENVKEVSSTKFLETFAISKL